ncbi:zinc-finger homeodomain protein 5-like [Andrographis paniculata]|uniref:zinc-finger homeodomain protein 5-like n=1 Tax=Andrographis paniculata TaxID=175694 RepID=UPI0021E80C8A|nr:zinc-finger homeodomain protein 5-like [Andrographis paniculata]
MSLPGEDKEMMRMQAYSNSAAAPSMMSPTRGPDPNNPGGSKSSRPRISYRECLKNHAATIGGHVTDGCGEFMPSGDDGTLEALKCAACNCHRNFHRKEHPGDPSGATATAAAMVHPLQLPPPLPSPSMSQHRAAAAAHWGSVVQPLKIAFGSGGGGAPSAGTDSSSDELNFNTGGGGGLAPPPPQFGGRKRFRTKFTAEQKEKMLEFAEKLGWRIPREDDSEVQRFCSEVGVKRQVFKVWMHNNKTSSSSKKTPPPPQEQLIMEST